MDLQTLLEMPRESFLSEAFWAFLGRDIDDTAQTYYGNRLSSGVPKIVILAEIRSSSEGKDRLDKFSSKRLDKIVWWYARIRKLPIGSFRWIILKLLLRYGDDCDNCKLKNSWQKSNGRRNKKHVSIEEKEGYTSRDLMGRDLSINDVIILYKAILSREPESIDTIKSHVLLSNLYGLIRELISSEEYYQKKGLSSSDVRSLYRVILGRDPENETIIEQHVHGSSLESIVHELIRSEEFLGKYNMQDRSESKNVVMNNVFELIDTVYAASTNLTSFV